MVTHPIVRYYNSRMQPVAPPYLDSVAAPLTNRDGEPYPLFTFFCQRCDLPFMTPIIRTCCAACVDARVQAFEEARARDATLVHRIHAQLGMNHG